MDSYRSNIDPLPRSYGKARKDASSSIQEPHISLRTVDLPRAQYRHHSGTRMEFVQSEVLGGGFRELLYRDPHHARDVPWVEIMEEDEDCQL